MDSVTLGAFNGGDGIVKVDGMQNGTPSTFETRKSKGMRILTTDMLARRHTTTSRVGHALWEAHRRRERRACLKISYAGSRAIDVPVEGTPTPNHSFNAHAPDQTGSRPQPIHCLDDLARPAHPLFCRNWNPFSSAFAARRAMVTGSKTYPIPLKTHESKGMRIANS